MRTLLSALTRPQQAGRSASLRAHLAGSPQFRQSRRIALFRALPGEPDLDGLTADPDRRFAFPRIDGNELTFHILPAEPRWETGPWRLIEPDPAHCEPAPAGWLDLVVVPGLAFSVDGHRLGRGGGFYDRFLARVPHGIPRIGAGFACQLRPQLPTDTHDQCLDAIVTEDGWCIPRSSRLEPRA